MATIQSALRTVLLAADSLTALIGEKVYSQPPQNGSPPYVVYQPKGERHVGHLTGRSSLARIELAYACVSTEKATAEAIATEVRRALDTLAGKTVDGIVIRCVLHIVTEETEYLAPGDGDSEAGFYVARVVLGAWYVPSAPSPPELP